MADWSTPSLTSTYTSVLDTFKNRDVDLAVMFSPTYATSLTNVPTGAVRWNPTGKIWEIYSGTAWGALDTIYNINVDLLDGQHGSYYLAWANLTGVPTTFAPSAHTHDDRYYTETEADGRYGNNLFVSGNTIALRTPGNVALTTITVPYATNAGTVGGFSVGQSLLTTSDVLFNSLSVTAAANADTILSIIKGGSTEARLKTVANALVFSVAAVGAEAERLRVDNASNVTPPSAGGGNIGTASLRWNNVFAATFSDGTNALLNSSGNVAQVGPGAGVTAVAFLAGGSERARITSGGRLGIGTNNPSASIHVSLAANEGLRLQNLSAGGGSQFIAFHETGGTRVAYVGNASAATPDSFNIWSERATASLVFGTNGVARLRIDPDGNVGVGSTPNAAAILDLVSTTKGFRAPSMTTTQRDAIVSPVAGLLIYNNTLNTYQVFNGTNWTSVGGGATGGGSNAVFWENDQSITTPYTITAGKNAMTAGPITVGDGISVTVPSGSVWTIL
jgi:hypothetical protein